MELSGSMEFMNKSECKQYPPEMFFPSDGVGVTRAQQVCGGCVVRQECLDYALENRVDHGVWGGASERERRKILKARRRESAATAEDAA